MKIKSINRKGSVSAFVVAIGVIMSILGTAMLSVAYNARMAAIRETKKLAAQVAADAGLTKAIYEMNQQIKDKPWNDDTLPSAIEATIPYFDGVFSYTISKVDGNYVIQSTGEYKGTEKTITATLRVRSIHEFAIFGDEGVALYNSTKVDWYNNQPDDENMIIATNSTGSDDLSLMNNAFINGDVKVGAGGETSITIRDLGADIAGNTGVLDTTIEMPSVIVPSYLSSASSDGKINKDETVTTSGKYSEINLGNNETVTIDGNVELYVTGKITLGKNASIQVTDGSSLTIYAADNIESKNSSSFINDNSNPKSLQIMGLDSVKKIVLKNSGDMYAVVYSPNANMEVKNSGDFTAR